MSDETWWELCEHCWVSEHSTSPAPSHRYPENARPEPVPYPDAALGDGSKAVRARAWFWWGYGAVCGGVHVMPPEWCDQRRELWRSRWGSDNRRNE